MCGCTLCLGLPYKHSGLRRCSTRQPTVYSYTASHRSPCIRVDSPTQFHLHQHHVHYHPDSQFNNSINHRDLHSFINTMFTTIPTHNSTTVSTSYTLSMR